MDSFDKLLEEYRVYRVLFDMLKEKKDEVVEELGKVKADKYKLWYWVVDNGGKPWDILQGR